MISIRSRTQILLEEDLPRVLSLLILAYLEEKTVCVRIWGKHGKRKGEFNKPHGIAMLPSGEIVVADTENHRIQVFTPKGKFLRMWESGENSANFYYPYDITALPSGGIIVTYRYCVRVFTSEGKFIRKWGAEQGQSVSKEGQFNYPSGIAVLPSPSGSSKEEPEGSSKEESEGSDSLKEESKSSYEIIITDMYNNRVQVFTPEGKFLRMWGKEQGRSGHKAEEFSCPIDVTFCSPFREVLIVDMHNHRIQVFTSEGKFLRMWGKRGHEAGELYYPTGITTLPSGKVIITDCNNHRIQVFTPRGKFLYAWGKEGHRKGELYCPHNTIVLPSEEIVIVDTLNHRLQVLQTILD